VFEWLLSSEARIWIFIFVCIVAVFLAAAASLLELFWEIAPAEVVGLIFAAQFGFFIGILAFTLVFLGLFAWFGRPAKVRRPAQS